MVNDTVVFLQIKESQSLQFRYTYCHRYHVEITSYPGIWYDIMGDNSDEEPTVPEEEEQVNNILTTY